MKGKSSNGRLTVERLSDRPQLNFRVRPQLKNEVESEIKRQGRKRDFVAEQVWSHFLAMKQAERDAICSKAA